MTKYSTGAGVTNITLGPLKQEYDHDIQLPDNGDYRGSDAKAGSDAQTRISQGWVVHALEDRPGQN